MDRASPPFRAYAARKQALVAIAALAPLFVLIAWTFAVDPAIPFALRPVGLLMIAIFAPVFIEPVRGLFVRGPMLDVSTDGFRWRGWSNEVIPWSAVKRWQVKSYLGIRYVTLWLHDPRRHRAATSARWTQRLNSWTGQGDISIPGGGLGCRFEEIADAFARFAPEAPLPTDPRLARRLLKARERRRRDA